jgi:hypothetical protein
MIDKKGLIKEVEKEFNKVKNELGFEATLEELEDAFKIYDGVISSEFVSTNFSRQLCSRILDNYMGWHNYLNGILIPNSGFLASQTEANLFNNQEDREMVWKMIKKTMEYSTTHSLIGLTKNKKLEAQFIDDTLKYWKDVFSPNLKIILLRANEAWKN